MFTLLNLASWFYFETAKKAKIRPTLTESNLGTERQVTVYTDRRKTLVFILIKVIFFKLNVLKSDQ